jgi:hypothetical protein
MPASTSPIDKSKSNEMLRRVKERDQSSFEPYFKPNLGFCYNGFESFSLEEQVAFFESLEKSGVASPIKTLFTILKCNKCSSPYFCIKHVCTFCRSSNIARGTAIEHDTCGNVDFDHNYMSHNGKMLCGKCNRELKALGVDYSKISHFYKCQDCNAMLPSIELHYGCLHCGKYSMQDEPEALQLFKYIIEPEKLSALYDKNIYISSIKDRLDKIGIGSKLNDTIAGSSSIQHTFDLAIYDKHDHPLVVVYMLEPTIGRDQDDETLVLSFIGRCMDANISNKVLISFLKFGERANVLAYSHALNLIEVTDLGNNSQLENVVDTIRELTGKITDRSTGV